MYCCCNVSPSLWEVEARLISGPFSIYKRLINVIFFLLIADAAFRRPGSPPSPPIEVPPGSRIYIQMPGDHVFVGDLLQPLNPLQSLFAPVFVRTPGGVSSSASDIQTLHNNNNMRVREGRCYITLPNHTILMAFLEPNLHVIHYPTSTVVVVRLGEYNNTLYSGVLRVGQGYRPDWLPIP